MITECANRVAKSMMAKRDTIIRQAIIDRIGDNWMLEDLQGRLSSTLVQHSGVETFYLDGKPLVEFYPAEPTHDYHDYSHYVGFNQKYRMLGPEQGGQ